MMIILAILGFLVFGITSGQDRARDVPIVSDKPVAKTDSIRIVDKDEQQRIVDRLMERIQKLEDRAATSEDEIKNLKDRIFNIEEEIEGD